MTLWGRMTSVNVQKVAWVLAETSLAAKQIDAGGAFGGLNDATYRAMNPNGRVPTLKEGDFVLWESNAICRYLVNAYGGPLATKTIAQTAEADMWMEWFQNGAYAPFIQMFYQTIRLPTAKRDPQKLATALDQLNAQYSIAEAALAGKSYILGDQLSLADIPLGASLFRYFDVDIDRPGFPALAAYYERLKARPAYRDCVMIDYESLRAKD
ncbi:glutathione S-transferase family protein [Rhodobacteraceae bacterium]|nr:glutathione S-transferase family protein [Paracoccaceae bacterium]